MSEAPTEASPWVYERPIPAGVRVAVALGAVGLLACFPLALLLILRVLVFRQYLGRDWVQALLDLVPFGEVTVIGSLIGLAVVPLLAAAALPAWLRRRYGAVEVHRDQLVFRFAFAPGWARQTVLAEQVRGRTPVAHGLLLEGEDRGAFTRALFPLLVPVTDEAEQAKLLAYLDAAAPAPGAAGAVFGRAPPPWFVASLAVAMLVPLAPPVALFAARFGEPIVFLGGLVLWVPLLGAVAWVDTHCLQPRYRKLHLGAEALLLANRRIPYDELDAVATGGDQLAFVAGKRRLRIELRDELPAALALLGERLADRERPLAISAGLPAWARPAWRRNRLALVLALTAAWWTAGLGAGLSDPPLYDDAYVIDDDDQYLRVVFRISDRVPRLVSILEDAPGATQSLVLDDRLTVPGLWAQSFGRRPCPFDLDLDRGRGWHPKTGGFEVDPATRWHHVTALGVRHTSTAALPAALTDAVLAARDATFRQQDSLPALLEPALGQVAEPVVQAWLRGETSRRTYDVRDAEGDRLLWVVSHGAPLVAIVAPAGRPLRLFLRGVHHEDTTPGLPIDLQEGGLYWFDAGAPLALGLCPPLEVLREAQRAIEGGAPVREALGPVARPRLAALARPDEPPAGR